MLRPVLHIPFRESTEVASWRIYAFADPHGYADALAGLLDDFHRHRASHPAELTLLAGLGDYVNRGPQSRGVIARLVDEQQAAEFDGVKKIFLRGNHDISLISLINDTISPLRPISMPFRSFMDKGGVATFTSYGIDLRDFASGSRDEFSHEIAGQGMWLDPAGFINARNELRAAMPRSHIEFLETLSDPFVFGPYFFVHGGVDPSLPLDQQPRSVLHGTDERAHDFVRHTEPLGKIVVHGHTPTIAPISNPAQISIDTGIYKTGRLTGVCLTSDQTPFFMAAHTALPLFPGCTRPLRTAAREKERLPA